MKTVEHVLVVGDADTSVLKSPARITRTRNCSRRSRPTYPWPSDIDERSAAAMC